MDQQRLAGLDPATVEYIGPHGHHDLWKSCAFVETHRGWQGKHGSLMDERIFGITATRHQSANPVPHRPFRNSVTAGNHLTRAFETKDFGRARGRRVKTGALNKIGAVQAGRINTYQNFLCTAAGLGGFYGRQGGVAIMVDSPHRVRHVLILSGLVILPLPCSLCLLRATCTRDAVT